MSKHKIFKQIFDLPKKDLWVMEELIRTLSEAQREFYNVGVEFTYEGFTKYVERLHKQYGGIAGSGGHNRFSDQLKIVKGDNLDKIEDMAKKKKLL